MSDGGQFGFDFEPLSPAEPTHPAPWHSFSRGTLAGHFVHEQLEWLAAQGFAWDDTHTPPRLQQRCTLAGWGPQASTVQTWLAQVLRTPLPSGAPLAGLGRRLSEMSFWLPVQRLSAAWVGQACEDALIRPLGSAAGFNGAVPPLPQRQLHGLIMGFADLVYEHQGRYWVLDYKTNHLGANAAAYHPASMWAEVARHRYDVQITLYQLALHRLLANRLGDRYQPSQHLGGVVLWFLRGLDHPQHGLLHWPAPLPLLHSLDGALAQNPVDDDIEKTIA